MDTSLTPIVSVVMSVRNVSRFMGKSIGSILSQALRELELIIINDGSTDITSTILKPYILKDNNVRVFHNGTPLG